MHICILDEQKPTHPQTTKPHGELVGITYLGRNARSWRTPRMHCRYVHDASKNVAVEVVPTDHEKVRICAPASPSELTVVLTRFTTSISHSAQTSAQPGSTIRTRRSRIWLGRKRLSPCPLGSRCSPSQSTGACSPPPIPSESRNANTRHCVIASPGILNRETQTVDSQGRLHVQSRESATGVEQMVHAHRLPSTDAPLLTLPRHARTTGTLLAEHDRALDEHPTPAPRSPTAARPT